jgi:hypothetical protein
MKAAAAQILEAAAGLELRSPHDLRELTLSALAAVEEELGRLIEIVAEVVGLPTLDVAREPPSVADRAGRDEATSGIAFEATT